MKSPNLWKELPKFIPATPLPRRKKLSRHEPPMPRKADGAINWLHEDALIRGVDHLTESKVAMTLRRLKTLILQGALDNWIEFDHPYFYQS
jgi:hypothetical protein